MTGILIGPSSLQLSYRVANMLYATTSGKSKMTVLRHYHFYSESLWCFIMTVVLCLSRQIENYLYRNHETRKYLQEQAYRLQQGIVTTTTQQVWKWTMIIEFKCTTMYMFWPNLMNNCSSSRTVTHHTLVLVFVLQMIDRICVKVQDHLNSLRNSETDAILEDVRSAEKLIKDARNSKTVRIKRFHLWAHLESCFSSSFLNLIFDSCIHPISPPPCFSPSCSLTSIT